jgi:hypothetical protein
MGGGNQWVTADGSPAPAPQMPGAFQPGYATNDPGVLYPPGTPNSFAPWPTVSPYHMGNVAQDMNYNQRGLWFREILNKKRDYYFDIDVLSVTQRSPGKGLIGAETINIDPLTFGAEGAPMNTYGEAAYFAPGTDPFQPLSRLYVDDGVYPFASLFEDGDTTPVALDNTLLFPIRSLQMFREFRSAGLQLSGGYWDEDGSGLRASGWWGFEETQTFQRGQETINGVEITQAIIINQAGQILFAKNGGVSFDTGILANIVSDADIGYAGGTVGTQKYDVMYRASVSSEVGGGDVQLYLPDIGSPGSAIRLRPVYGAKYMYLGETFSFRGIDSGMSYELDGEDGASTSTTTFRPEPFDAASVTINENLFETQVNSRTRSHLAGALAGLRYDFGRSGNFKLWGQSSLGAMANHEEVRVFGFNAGETVVTRFITGTNMLDGDSTFDDTQRHTHVSPVFEQTFMSESKILAALPLVREVPILANANFRLGYTHTFIGNVARPGNSIQWNGFPRFPKVDIDYRNYYVGRTNVGLEWTY